jgi:hypothetical protein
MQISTAICICIPQQLLQLQLRHKLYMWPLAVLQETQQQHSRRQCQQAGMRAKMQAALAARTLSQADP